MNDFPPFSMRFLVGVGLDILLPGLEGPLRKGSSAAVSLGACKAKASSASM